MRIVNNSHFKCQVIEELYDIKNNSYVSRTLRINIKIYNKLLLSLLSHLKLFKD